MKARLECSIYRVPVAIGLELKLVATSLAAAVGRPCQLFVGDLPERIFVAARTVG